MTSIVSLSHLKSEPAPSGREPWDDAPASSSDAQRAIERLRLRGGELRLARLPLEEELRERLLLIRRHLAAGVREGFFRRGRRRFLGVVGEALSTGLGLALLLVGHDRCGTAGGLLGEGAALLTELQLVLKLCL